MASMNGAACAPRLGAHHVSCPLFCDQIATPTCHPGTPAVVELAQLLPGDGVQGPAAASSPQEVAVKRLKPDTMDVDRDVMNFVAETRLLLRMNNP